MTKDESVMFLELVTHPGWKLVEKWFDNKEKTLINELKKFIAIPGQDETKWLNYHSGQFCIIEHFRTFVKQNSEKPFRETPKKKSKL